MFKLRRLPKNFVVGNDYHEVNSAISDALKGDKIDFTLSEKNGRALIWVKWNTDPARESLFEISCDSSEEVADLRAKIALRNRQIRDLRRSLRK